MPLVCGPAVGVTLWCPVASPAQAISLAQSLLALPVRVRKARRLAQGGAGGPQPARLVCSVADGRFVPVTTGDPASEPPGQRHAVDRGCRRRRCSCGKPLALMSLTAVTSVEPTVAPSAGARNGWERPWQTTRRRGGNGGSSRAWRCSVHSLKPDTTTAASGTQGAAYKTVEIGRADRGGCGQCRHLGGWEYQIRRDGAFFPVVFLLSPCRRYAIAATIFCGMSGAWKSQPRLFLGWLMGMQASF